MNTLVTFIKGFMEDESGLTAVEYAVAGGLVVGGMVAAFVALGDAAEAKIGTIATAVANDGS